MATLREGASTVTACVGTTCANEDVDFSATPENERDFALSGDLLFARVAPAADAEVSLRIVRCAEVRLRGLASAPVRIGASTRVECALFGR